MLRRAASQKVRCELCDVDGVSVQKNFRAWHSPSDNCGALKSRTWFWVVAKQDEDLEDSNDSRHQVKETNASVQLKGIEVWLIKAQPTRAVWTLNILAARCKLYKTIVYEQIHPFWGRGSGLKGFLKHFNYLGHGKKPVMCNADYFDNISRLAPHNQWISLPGNIAPSKV